MTIVLPRGENTNCHQKMKKISVCLSASSRSQWVLSKMWSANHTTSAIKQTGKGDQAKQKILAQWLQWRRAMRSIGLPNNSNEEGTRYILVWQSQLMTNPRLHYTTAMISNNCTFYNSVDRQIICILETLIDGFEALKLREIFGRKELYACVSVSEYSVSVEASQCCVYASLSHHAKLASRHVCMHTSLINHSQSEQ